MKPQPEYRIYNKKTGERAKLPSNYSLKCDSTRDYAHPRAAELDIHSAKRVLGADWLRRYEEDVQQAEKTLKEARTSLFQAALVQSEVQMLFQDGLEIREATWTENPEKVVKDESFV